MTHNLSWKKSLLIASVLVATLAMSSQACHKRRACTSPGYAPSAYTYSGTAYATPTGHPAAGTYLPANGGYYGGAYNGYGAYGNGYGNGYGYDFGRPGYNPGGLGGPMSGLGVRPGWGFGGLGLGR